MKNQIPSFKGNLIPSAIPVMIKSLKSIFTALFVLALLVSVSLNAGAVSKTAATGNFNTSGTWTPAGVPLSTTGDICTWIGGSLSGPTDWNLPGNWDGGVPLSTSNVIIPIADSAPVLPDGKTINSMNIQTGGILNATIGTPTLTIGGATGWTNNGTFNAGTGSTIIFTNSVATINGETSFKNVTIAGGASLTPGTNNIMVIGGSFTLSGTINAATNSNTIEYNGAAQTVVNPNGSPAGYSNLVLSGTGIKTMPGSVLSILGNFSISGSASNTALAAINTAGDFTLNSGTTFTAGTFTHSIGGNFSNSGTLTPGSGTVNFNGSLAQTITGTTTFNTLKINNAIGVTLAAAVTVKTLTIGDVTSGSVLNDGGFQITGFGGALTLGNSGTLKLGSGIAATAFPTFVTYSLTSGTVDYGSTASQTIVGRNYGNLTSSGVGARTLDNTQTIGIAGIFTPGGGVYVITESTCQFNGANQTVPAFYYNNLDLRLATSSITLAGDGIIYIAGVFMKPSAIPRTVTGSTVQFNGDSQTVPGFTFFNLDLSFVTTSITLSNSATIGIAGTFSIPGPITKDISYSTIEFNGIDPQFIPAFTFNNLILNNITGASLNGSDATVSGTLTLTSGILATGSNSLIVSNTSTNAISEGSSSSYIDGNLRRGILTGTNTYSFPVGTSSGYTPVSLALTSVTAGGNLTARSANGVSANYPSALDNTKKLARYWTVTDSGIGTFTANAAFTYLSGDLIGGATQGNLKSYKFNSPSSYNYPATSTGTLGFTASGITTFSEFGAGECLAPAAPTAGSVSVTYNGSAHTGAAIPPAGSTIVWYTASTGGIVTSAPSGTSAGSYSAWGESVSSSGCKSNTRTEVTVVVIAKSLTVTSTGPGKTYGTALNAGTSISNFTAGATGVGTQAVTGVTLTPDAAGLSATTAAGAAYVVTPSLATGSNGFLESNYTMSYVPYNGTVIAKQLTIADPTSLTLTKEYDGGTTAAVTAGAFSGVEIVDAANVGVTAAANYANANAGTSKTITVVYTLTGTASGNYIYPVNYTVLTGVIGTKALTVTATGPAKQYGTALTSGVSTPNFTAGATGVGTQAATGVTLTPDAAGLSATTAAGAAYVVTPSLATGTGGFLESNYTMTYAPYNGIVTKKSLTVAATGPTKQYGTALTAGASTTNFTAGATGVGTQAVTGVTLTPDAAGLSATTAAGAAYAVTPSQATGTGGFMESNYTMTYTPYNATVSKKSLTVTATGPSKTYGTALSAGTSITNFTAGATGVGTQAVIGVTLNPDAAGLSATTAAGAAYAVTPSLATGTGGFLESNYTMTYAPYNGTVGAKQLTIADPISLTVTKEYDGGTTAALTAGVLTGVEGSETVTVSAAANYDNANVGSSETITVVYTLGGEASANYIKPVNYTVLTGVILAKALTVTATGPGKSYGTALSAGTNITNFTAGATGVGTQAVTSVTLTPDDAGLSATTAAGSAYVVTPSLATGIGGFLASNYNITYTAYTGDVAPKQLTITVPAFLTFSKEYNGGTTTVVTQGALTGVEVSETVTVSAAANYDNINVGTGKTITVVYTLAGANAGNYTKPVDYVLYTGVITSRTMTITSLSALSKPYDATTTAILIGTPTLSGVMAGDEANVTMGGSTTANFSSANVGTNIPVIITGFTISGSASGNYTLTQPSGLTADITPVLSDPDPITGNTTLCEGSTTQLHDATSGGSWSSADNTIAAVNAGGLVTGISAGLTNIIYTITDGVNTASATREVTVNPIPEIVHTVSASRCDAGTLTLIATASVGSISWYAGMSGGSLSGTGTSFTTPPIASTTSYYAEAFSNGCVSERTAVAATIHEPQKAPFVAAVMQPTCSIPTGNVSLNGLPATGTWTLTINPGSKTTSGTGSTTTITSLTAGTYTFFVTSAEGCISPQSGIAVIHTQPVVLSVPVSKTGTSLSQTWFTAAWETLAAADGYRLDVATDIGFTQFVSGYLDKDVGNVSTYSVIGLTQKSTYFYRVRSYNVCGNSNSSFTIPVTTLDDPPVASVASPAKNILQTSFTAGWSASASATGYRLDVSTDSGFNTFVAGYYNKDAGNVTTFNVTGLNADITYFYRIRAINTGGPSPDSGTIALNTLPVPPDLPAAYSASGLIQTGFLARWSTSPTAGNYSLDVSADAGFATFLAGYNGKNVGNVTSYTVSGLDALSPYYYRVRAYNTGGTKGHSNTISARTLSVPPNAPTGLVSSSCNDLVTLKWRKNADPYFLRYRIYAGTGNNPLALIDSTSASISDTSKIISGLTRGISYNFRVTAVNFDGPESPYSLPTTAVVSRGLIPRITLKWNEVLVCYNLGDSIQNYQWNLGGSSIPGATGQFMETNKVSGTYTVVTYDQFGCRNSSNEIKVVYTKSLTLYPNPASVRFTLKLDGVINGKAVISMFSATGVKVLEIQTENANEELIREIAVNNLDNGSYVVQVIVNQKELYNAKMIIRK